MKLRHRKPAIVRQAKRVIRARWRANLRRMAQAQLSSYMTRRFDEAFHRVLTAA